MNLQEYKEYLIPNLENYNIRTKEYLERELSEQGIIKRSSPNDDELTLDKLKTRYKNSLVGSVDELGIEAIKFFEKWEFIKSYEYTVLFKLTNLNKDVILEKLHKKKFNLDSPHHEELYSIIKEPTMYEFNDLILLKFSLFRDAIHPQTEEKLKVKYPMIAVLYTQDNILEIRYDSIKAFFVEDHKIFSLRNIQTIKSWLVNHLNLGIDNYIFEKIINDIKNNPDVELEGQDMQFQDGGTARLKIGGRDEIDSEASVLPLLGDLRELIKKNENEFNIGGKQILETWICEKEDEASYNWITLSWPHENLVKWKRNKVKFQFNYLEEDVCSIYYYSGPIGMERMNDVARYIISNENLIE